MSKIFKSVAIPSFLLALSLSLGSNQLSYAYCPKCAAIEKQRAEEQARLGPQPMKYYDEQSSDDNEKKGDQSDKATKGDNVKKNPQQQTDESKK